MSLPSEFLYELHKHFTGDIRTDTGSKALYSTDASIYQIEPLGVVLPRTQEDLIAAVELSAKYKIPILPRGAGTSLAGQAVGPALILDCSRWLNSIVEIDPESYTAIVEPGVVLSSLNLAAAQYGLMFGPDPASAERATMGGVIANNATGAHSIVYGMAADHLISADVIMADGSLAILGERSTLDNSLVSNFYSAALDIRERYVEVITKNWPHTWRNSAGYRLNYLLPWSPNRPSQWAGEYPAVDPSRINLASLLAGSEGTLAVIRRAKVNLVQKPKHTILAVLSYQSIGDACDDVPRLLTHHPSAIELIPQMMIRLAYSIPEVARQMGWVVGDPPALLIVEFSGDQPSALKEAAYKVGEILTLAESRDEQAHVWNLRKVGLGILDSRPQSARPIAFIEDCAIPVDRLGEFVREIEKLLSAHGAYGGIYAHASGGCLHIRPVLDMKMGRGVHSMRAIAEETLSLTLRLGGSMSSEHGDGLARGEWLRQTYGDEVFDAMRSLKQAADPHNLLNPRKLFNAPKMDANLRYNENYQVKTWAPVLDFSRNGNLVTAIEQCNGQGVCRKDTGVMCPSFQATREEMHSTRGRANLLRALISNDMSLRGANEVSDEAISSLTTKGLLRQEKLSPRNDMMETVARALDLCLACKGCKAECPSGVDMAKLKYEFENQYYKTRSRPLHDYVFGYFHLVAALASEVALLSNALMQMPVVKNIVAGLLGITPERPFPQFTNQRARLNATLRHSAVQNDISKVIFLPDPFSRYVEPQVEQAALDVLTLCGYDVHVLPVIGAGASLLSKGFLEAAKQYAGRMLEALNQIDPTREAMIVGIEPPEIYTLKHEYPDLLSKRIEGVSTLAARTWLLDEFLLRSENFNKLRVATIGQQTHLDDTKQKIRFHPHCHQRAEILAADGLPVGTNATIAVLRSCGYDVELTDAGCCGMAGAFGYEAQHYELSMKIGEMKLFPMLRQSKAENRKIEVAATGAACRMQIQQGTGLKARHSIEFVRERLTSIIAAGTHP